MTRWILSCIGRIWKFELNESSPRTRKAKEYSKSTLVVMFSVQSSLFILFGTQVYFSKALGQDLLMVALEALHLSRSWWGSVGALRQTQPGDVEEQKLIQVYESKTSVSPSLPLVLPLLLWNTPGCPAARVVAAGRAACPGDFPLFLTPAAVPASSLGPRLWRGTMRAVGCGLEHCTGSQKTPERL